MKIISLGTMFVLTTIWVGEPMAMAQHEGDDRGMHLQAETHSRGMAGTQDAQSSLPLCPVMGDPVDFNIKTMTDEGPVYFCCPMCIKKFNENPDKYAEKVARQRKQLHERERIQVTCPVSGEPVDKNVLISRGDEKIYFCCAGCKPKYEADPKKYAAKLEASYTYQTHCPVMGGKIDPTAFTDLPTGERIYFCCSGCDKKFLTDPAKYAQNLEKQGIHLNMEKLMKALKHQ